MKAEPTTLPSRHSCQNGQWMMITEETTLISISGLAWSIERVENSTLMQCNPEW
jgi:hypothetical protein